MMPQGFKSLQVVITPVTGTMNITIIARTPAPFTLQVEVPHNESMMGFEETLVHFTGGHLIGGPRCARPHPTRKAMMSAGLVSSSQTLIEGVARSDITTPQSIPELGLQQVLQRIDIQLPLPQPFHGGDGGAGAGDGRDAGDAVADGAGADAALVGARSLAAGGVDNQVDRAVGQVVEQVGPALADLADRWRPRCRAGARCRPCRWCR